MALPLHVPTLPQLAKSAKELPAGENWCYEPKWDGYRCIAFIDGDSVVLQSRNGRDLTRYFPELAFPEGRYVIDGEIVVFTDDGKETDFDLLGQRIHPADSRVQMLSQKTPATFIAFDVLSIDDEVLLELSQSERRARLAEIVADPVQLTPSVGTPEEAEAWLHNAEGVIAKKTDAPYKPGERVGMVKIKRVRTLDAVVRGWRPGKAEGTLGALILGLYGSDGKLREIGHSSGFSAKEKKELPARLKPFETGERGSGEPSRWSAGRDLEWIALRPELVVEIAFDHMSNGRIRHNAKVLRWRDDKPPEACTLDQLS
jgi:ATP-dependent DNA ligase